MQIIRKGITLICLAIFITCCTPNRPAGSAEDRKSFQKTKDAILDGFAKGDVEAVLAVHHPDVVKYFGGKNVVVGRAGLRKQLEDMFHYAKVEFVQNEIESTIFNGNSVIESSLFGIKISPKNGDSASVFRGRSMVVYVRYKDSPTGWASLREMTQEGPTK